MELVKNNLDLIWFKTDKQLTSYDVYKIWKGYTYNNENELLLVSIKWKFNVLESKNLWKENNIFLLGDFSQNFEIDKKWLIHGITFYQQMFDTQEGSFYHSFVKWKSLTDDEIQDYNNGILADLGLKLVRNKKRIEITWKFDNLEKIQENLLENKDVNYQLSFLVGLGLFYGRLQTTKDNTIVWFQITFNFENMWLDIDSIIETLKNFYQENKLLINITDDSSNLTISSHDWQVEKFVASFYLDEFVIWKYQKAKQIKNKILDFIEKNQEIKNKQQAKQLIENNDIKIISF